MLKSAPDRFQDLRDAVRALCAQFPDSYHREIDARRFAPATKAGGSRSA